MRLQLKPKQTETQKDVRVEDPLRPNVDGPALGEPVQEPGAPGLDGNAAAADGARQFMSTSGRPVPALWAKDPSKMGPAVAAGGTLLAATFSSTIVEAATQFSTAAADGGIPAGLLAGAAATMIGMAFLKKGSPDQQPKTIRLDALGGTGKAHFPDVLSSATVSDSIAIGIYDPKTKTGYVMHEMAYSAKDFEDFVTQIPGDRSGLKVFVLGSSDDSFVLPGEQSLVGQELLKYFDASQITTKWLEGGRVGELRLDTATGRFHIDDEPLPPALLLETRQRFVNDLGGRLHDVWRLPRRREDGTYEPRVKTTKDENWIAAHGGETQVDIANTAYADLPSDWQADNRASAEVSANLIYQATALGLPLDEAFVERAGAMIHEKWLERNGAWASEDQKLPYDQLSETEKEKDRAIIREAIGLFHQKI